MHSRKGEGERKGEEEARERQTTQLEEGEQRKEEGGRRAGGMALLQLPSLVSYPPLRSSSASPPCTLKQATPTEATSGATAWGDANLPPPRVVAIGDEEEAEVEMETLAGEEHHLRLGIARHLHRDAIKNTPFPKRR